MKGKAIYQPEGAAAEYAKYACNFYKGCSNSCTYCYCNRWKWGNTPTLKKCFKDEDHALAVFEKELKENLPELQKYGLFFSFTTDPLIEETWGITFEALRLCVLYSVNAKVLTKSVIWLHKTYSFGKSPFVEYFNIQEWKKYIAVGFTLTGRDELEPNASTNAERIEAMKKLHDEGFKTFVSAEPIIDFKSSKDVMCAVMDTCELYKIGLKSGKKYDKSELREFVEWVISYNRKKCAKFYFKDNLLAQAGITRDQLPANCVDRDYNMFNN